MLAVTASGHASRGKAGGVRGDARESPSGRVRARALGPLLGRQQDGPGARIATEWPTCQGPLSVSGTLREGVRVGCVHVYVLRMTSKTSGLVLSSSCKRALNDGIEQGGRLWCDTAPCLCGGLARLYFY